MSKLNPMADLRSALLEESACEAHPPLRRSESLDEAEMWWNTVQKCSDTNKNEHLRWLGRNDLFFLLTYLMNCKFLKHQWYFDRCVEYQNQSEGCIDLWSRGAGKSVIGTFGANVQSILNDPNITIGIFSHTRPIAKQFLRQIKFEFENNELLKQTYPDVLWQDPKREAPKWSEDDGIIVRRTANPKEATVEAHGLTDGQPTSKHFAILDWDDVIDEKAVTSPEMIDKVSRAWELSLNLGATDPLRFRVKGTFYAVGDTYHTMIERGFGKVRLRSIVKDGKSLLLSDIGLAQKKQSMSPYTWAMQILLDPRQADQQKGFKKEWIKHWKTEPAMKSLNRYIFVDPGGKGESSSSYTAYVVIGLGADKHIYILYLMKDRFSLVQRMETLFQLHREYDPMNVYYERYSMQADVEALRDRMTRENYRFNLTEVGAASGLQIAKDKRIEKLQPDFSNGLILLPPLNTMKHKMFDGKEVDSVESFVNDEFLGFPYTRNKDCLDALSRIHDPNVNLIYPRSWGRNGAGRPFGSDVRDSGSWLSE